MVEKLSREEIERKLREARPHWKDETVRDRASCLFRVLRDEELASLILDPNKTAREIAEELATSENLPKLSVGYVRELRASARVIGILPSYKGRWTDEIVDGILSSFRRSVRKREAVQMLGWGFVYKVSRMYGSWNEALKAHGLEPLQTRRIYPREKLEELEKRLREIQPHWKERTVRDRAGSLLKVLQNEELREIVLNPEKTAKEVAEELAAREDLPSYSVGHIRAIRATARAIGILPPYQRRRKHANDIVKEIVRKLREVKPHWKDETVQDHARALARLLQNKELASLILNPDKTPREIVRELSAREDLPNYSESSIRQLRADARRIGILPPYQRRKWTDEIVEGILNSFRRYVTFEEARQMLGGGFVQRACELHGSWRNAMEAHGLKMQRRQFGTPSLQPFSEDELLRLLEEYEFDVEYNLGDEEKGEVVKRAVKMLPPEILSQLVQGRSREAVGLGAILVACRQIGVPVRLEREIDVRIRRLVASKREDWRYSKKVKMFLRWVKGAYKALALTYDGMPTITEDIESNVEFVVERLRDAGYEIPASLEEKAMEITRKIPPTYLAGKSPRGIATAIVYHVMKKEGIEMTLRKMTKIAGITEITLRKRLKELREREILPEVKKSKRKHETPVPQPEAKLVKLTPTKPTEEIELPVEPISPAPYGSVVELPPDMPSIEITPFRRPIDVLIRELGSREAYEQIRRIRRNLYVQTFREGKWLKLEAGDAYHKLDCLELVGEVSRIVLLTDPEEIVLRALTKRDGMTYREIAKFTGYSPSYVSQIARQLEKRGFVRIDPCAPRRVYLRHQS